MNKLIVMVGLPRSGKSTWARKQGHPIVCPDAIRLALHGQVFLESAERHVWAAAHTMVQSLFLAGHTRVILDATNCTKRRRFDWLSTDRFATYFKVIVATPEECVARANKDGRQYLIPVIQKMFREFEFLDTHEKPWPFDGDEPRESDHDNDNEVAPPAGA